jgi:hypothetical protein
LVLWRFCHFVHWFSRIMERMNSFARIAAGGDEAALHVEDCE